MEQLRLVRKQRAEERELARLRREESLLRKDQSRASTQQQLIAELALRSGREREDREERLLRRAEERERDNFHKYEARLAEKKKIEVCVCIKRALPHVVFDAAVSLWCFGCFAFCYFCVLVRFWSRSDSSTGNRKKSSSGRVINSSGEETAVLFWYMLPAIKLLVGPVAYAAKKTDTREGEAKAKARNRGALECRVPLAC
jgi:hypothetical protein